VAGGEISHLLAEGAREHRMYVAGSLYERAGDTIYNTVALFDRVGALAGTYHKVHLPEGEDEEVTAGDGYPVFNTDFGKVGALVCFDLNFPEAARCLALNGAEIIVWPTMWSEPRAHITDIMMRARAIENKVFLVAANYTQQGRDPSSVHIGRSAIVDWDGMVLADTGRREGVATSTIDLDASKEVFGWPADLLGRRRPIAYGPVSQVQSTDC
jgi:predicted amidohydrolase